MTDLYIDEPCVVSFHIGELGWLLQYFQGYLRYLKLNKYKDYKFILFMNPVFHVLVQDFISYTVDLPKEFYDLGLETDCYEAPLPGSLPGSLTPPDVYSGLIEYFRNFYNKEKAIEIFPPRGCNDWINSQTQSFIKYNLNKKIDSEKPIITVFPRGRSRASNRNVPEYVWKEVVEELTKNFYVVLGGTPDGSFLSDYKDSDSLKNMISYDKDDKLEHIITYLNNSICSVSSQSGPTHISLLSGCPSYILGHERERHSIALNRTKTIVMFRELADYRAVSSDEIIGDLKRFVELLLDNNILPNIESKEIKNEETLTELTDHEKALNISSNTLAYLIHQDRGIQ